MNDNLLTKENIEFAYTIATRLSRTMLADTHEKSIDLADLQQESFLGLYEAAQRYDTTQGVDFRSLAYIWCRKYVLRAMHKYSTALTVPANFDWTEELKMLHLDVTMQDLDLDAEDNGGLADRLLYMAAADEQAEREAQEAMAERLACGMKGLTRQERQVLILLFGLEGRELSPQETAHLLHITAAHVTRVKERALRKIEATLNSPTDSQL